MSLTETIAGGFLAFVVIGGAHAFTSIGCMSLALLPSTNVHRSTLTQGKRGTAETVAIMAKLAMGDWGARSERIRALALAIVRVAGSAGKDYLAEVLAIHRWVQTTIRYTRDPIGQETVQTPEYTAFVNQAGDCDDFSVLEAALLGALGHPTRFVTIGYKPQAFSHVYLEVQVRGRWMPLDPIMADKPVGWEAPNPTLRKVFPINRAEGFDPTRENLDGLGALPLLVPLLLVGGGAVAGGAAGYAFGRGVSRAVDDVGLLMLVGAGLWAWLHVRKRERT
jgi:predicted transglutaminase-like cysteine proteinase